MEEKIKVSVKPLALGLVIELVFITFLFWIMQMDALTLDNTAYNYEGWLHYYLQERWTFLMWLTFALLLLLPVLTVFKISPETLSVIYTFSFVGSSFTLMTITLLGAAFWVPYAWPKISPQWPIWMQINPEAAKIWYAGGPLDLGAWAAPLMYYFLLGASFTLAFVFLSVIWRRQWIEVEALPFPYARPVVEFIALTQTAPNEKRVGFLNPRGKWFWIGFLIGFVLYVPDVFHIATYGAIPRLPFSELLWGGLYAINLTATLHAPLVINWTPAIMSLLYFMPQDVLFTAWVANLVHWTIIPYIGVQIGAYPDVSAQGPWGYYGIVQQTGWPRFEYFFWFGVVGIGLWALFNGRAHLKNVYNAVVRKGNFQDEPALPYKLAVPSFLFFWVLWLVLMLAAGSHIGAALFFWIIESLMLLGYMRIRAEFFWGGGAWEVHWPGQVLAQVIGEGAPVQTIPALMSFHQGLVVASSQQFGGFEFKAIEAFKIGGETHTNPKLILWSAVIATFVGLLYAMIFKIVLGYVYGARNIIDWGGGPLMQWEAFTLGENIYESGKTWGPNQPEVAVMGAAWTFLLMFLKSKFVWFPLNGVAWMVTGCQLLPAHLFPFFSAWLWKYITWKVGGSELNRKMTVLALGLSLGYMLTRFLWLVVGAYVIGGSNIVV
jgi:hypothetical protein